MSCLPCCKRYTATTTTSHRPLLFLSHVATRELHKTCNRSLMLQTWGCWSWEIYCMEQFCCHIKQETVVVVGVKTSVCSGKMSKHATTCPLTVCKGRIEPVGYHSSVQFSKMLGFHSSTQIYLHPPPLCRNVRTKQSLSQCAAIVHDFLSAQTPTPLHKQIHQQQTQKRSDSKTEEEE